MRKPRMTIFAFVLIGVALVGTLTARDARAENTLQATPFAFIGTAEECGVAGSHIVTAAWLGGMGLPDNGGQNTTAADLDTNPNKNDPHRGLLLSKNGPTPDCSAAGATITGFNRRTTLTELGFDYRNGTHCGAGAPRFNITSTLGFTYFAGCAAGTKTPAPQDPAEWTRVRITLADQVFPASPAAPPFVFGPGGTQVRSLSIIFDEGTDTPGVEDPRGVGLAVIDNIDVGGRLIRTGTGIADGTSRNGAGKEKDKKDGDDGDDDGNDDHGGDDGDD
jgi:hypothetical protein